MLRKIKAASTPDCKRQTDRQTPTHACTHREEQRHLNDRITAEQSEPKPRIARTQTIPPKSATQPKNPQTRPRAASAIRPDYPKTSRPNPPKTQRAISDHHKPNPRQALKTRKRITSNG
ncbi:hypothetical protein EUGRSUZ_K01815 [Eucalyptus grandis]|uniref:Uncharacterized protein n=2 Tax=Eucalyptus grandis TaxID=71139 RepID=A0ACC3IUH4_EUCGR|nr:hypothetical protein EUGRSUZ_K01815 [Eucalyptus grandis]